MIVDRWDVRFCDLLHIQTVYDSIKAAFFGTKTSKLVRVRVSPPPQTNSKQRIALVKQIPTTIYSDFILLIYF